MRSGSLRDNVVVKKRTDEQDDYGAPLDVYNKLYDAKADVRYLSGSDLIKAGVDTNIEVITLKMRYDSRMAYDCVVETHGNQFDVVNIKPDRKRREFIVTAEREI